MDHRKTRRGRSCHRQLQGDNFPAVHWASVYRCPSDNLLIPYDYIALAYWSNWSHHSGTCVSHGTTDRECFFRGGGLGGRPRTPYDVPPWGRPPGARLGRGGRDVWEGPQSWQYDQRFEEVDESDEGGLNGVELDAGYAPKRFISDELHFTGIDLGAGRARQRRSDFVHDNYTGYSDGDGNDDDPYNMQLMLKEKEDILVERALERIARARALGKTNVKLSQAEIDALERAEQKQPPAPLPALAPKPAVRSRKAGPAKARPVDRKKGIKNDKSASNSPRIKAIEPAKRGRKDTAGEGESSIPYPLLLGGQADYAGGPVAQTRPSAPTSGPASRAASSHSVQQFPLAHQPLAYHQHPYFQGRYYSNPDAVHHNWPASNPLRAPRPDPSEPDWEPRARSSSSLVSYPIDQLPNPMHTSRAPRFDPNDPRFASPTTRRVDSGPSSPQPPMYRGQSDELLQRTRDPESPSTPDASSQERLTSEEDDGDAGGQGVEVEVTEDSDGQYTVQTRSQTAPKVQSKGKAKGARGKRKGR